MLPVVVITELEGKRHHPELGYFARQALRHARRAAGRRTAVSTSPSPSARTAAPSASSSTTPTPRRCPPASASATTTPASSRWPATWPTRATTSRSSPRTCRCGSRPRRSASTPRSTAPSRSTSRLRLDRHGRGRRHRPTSSTSSTTTRCSTSTTPATCPATPAWCCMSRAGQRARPGQGRQAGPPRARRPRGVRHPRPLRRAADRPRPAARPRGRHRLARRPRRHRQVGARPVRRAGGGAGAAYSTRRSWSSGRCSPSAARSWATCPAASRRRCRPGARRSSTPSARSPPPTSSTRSLDRGMLEVLPLTHIRGRSLHDAFVIVDEAQSLERNVLLTVLSRMGANSKVVLTHDVAQRDNLRVGPPRRRGRRGRAAQGPPAVRPRDPDPLGALADRGAGHRDAGARRDVTRLI